jgi:hypothetical protein
VTGLLPLRGRQLPPLSELLTTRAKGHGELVLGTAMQTYGEKLADEPGPDGRRRHHD